MCLLLRCNVSISPLHGLNIEHECTLLGTLKLIKTWRWFPPNDHLIAGRTACCPVSRNLRLLLGVHGSLCPTLLPPLCQIQDVDVTYSRCVLPVNTTKQSHLRPTAH